VRHYPAILASIIVAISFASGPSLAEQSKPDTKPGAKPTAVDRKGPTEPRCSAQGLCSNEVIRDRVKGKAPK
jgi:hypothetical protein